jgi:hypothetical protein
MDGICDGREPVMSTINCRSQKDPLYHRISPKLALVGAENPDRWLLHLSHVEQLL